MTKQLGYVPPPYIPLGQSDSVAATSAHQPSGENPSRNGTDQMQTQWSSGICACCDDMQSSYACGYRRTLRSKYNLQEAPCGDFITHFFCHMCAVCQEYREIREKSGDSEATDMKLAVVTAPTIQTMESDSK